MTRRVLTATTAVIVGLVGYYVVTGVGDALMLGVIVFCALAAWVMGVLS